MSEEIEKLIKIQGIINRDKYHLYINTDLEQKATWSLYQMFAEFDKYISRDNKAILDSDIDSIEDLINYLEKHKGFQRRW